MPEIDKILDATGNNLLRPFNTGITPFEPTIATIVLLTSPTPNSNEKDPPRDDYLDIFTSQIEQVSPLTGQSVVQMTKGMRIPKFSLDGKNDQIDYYGVFNNFSLTNVIETREQMTKIHMNFGNSWNAFFFGDKPMIYSFNGFFLDTKEYPYYQEFLVAYDKYLKGRKCIENKFEMLVSYDGKNVSGYILNINTGLDAQNPYSKTFSFNVLIKDESWYRMNFYKSSLNSASMSQDLNKLTNYYRLAKQMDISSDRASEAVQTDLNIEQTSPNDIGIASNASGTIPIG